jgi:hypothetical protein
MATTSQIAAFIPIKIPSSSFMFLSFLFDVFKIIREREFGGFREGRGIFFGADFGGIVGVGHERKIAEGSDNATKKVFFIYFFMCFFSLLFATR